MTLVESVGWSDSIPRVKLKELATKIGSGSTPRGGKGVYVPDGIPFIRSQNVYSEGFETEGLAYITDEAANALEGVKLSANDVLLNITGASIGRACRVPVSLVGGCVSQHVAIIRCTPALEPSFLLGFLRSPAIQDWILNQNYGVTRQALTKGQIENLDIPLPPLAEQRRIVARLGALTARLTRARSELARVPLLAKHLRQSVVANAFSGQLTAEWRAAHKYAALSSAEIETAHEAILGSKRRKPATAIDWKPEIDLPNGWRWASVDELVAITQYGSSAKTSDDPAGVPVLRMGNIQRGEIDWSSLKYLPTQHTEFPDLFLQAGDVLFNRTNSFELVGKSAVFRGSDHPVSYASYLIRLRCSAILPSLLARYINSQYGRTWIEHVASQQVGQANVNGSKLKALGVPLPPPNEQAEILRLLDIAFARADRLEAEAARATQLLDRLEAAILAKAFRGELVRQDPNDEPAASLLARIRQSRTATAKPKSKRRLAV